MKSSIFNVFESDTNGGYLSNTLTKSVIQLDEASYNLIKEYLKSDCRTQISKEYLEALIASGNVVDDALDEFAHLEFLFNTYQYDRSTLTIVLLSTLNCNCKCRYCFQSSHEKVQMTKREFDAINRFFANYIPNIRSLSLALFGGEPLLTWEDTKILLNNINDLCNKEGVDFKLSLTSNGVLLNDEIINDLLAKYKAGLIQVTIDGLTAEKHDSFRVQKTDNGTFQIINNNIKKIAQNIIENSYNTYILLRLNLFNNTLQELEDCLLTLKDYKSVIHVVARPLYHTETFKEPNSNLNNFYDFTERIKMLGFKTYDLQDIAKQYRHCEGAGGVNVFHIHPDLSLYKCGNSADAPFDKIGFIDKLGNLNIDHQQLINYIDTHNPMKDKKCRSCVKLPLCFGGCPLGFFKKNNERSCLIDNRPIHSILTECFG